MYSLNYSLPKVEKRKIQSRSDIVAYSKHMKALYSRIWKKFILSYVENLNNYKRKNQSAPNIKFGDKKTKNNKKKDNTVFNLLRFKAYYKFFGNFFPLASPVTIWFVIL